VARGLAAEGAAVALLARSGSRLETAAQSIGNGALAIPTDVGDPAAVRVAFAEIEERWGRLDLLVNNAAVAWPHRIEAATDAQLESEVSTNLLGPIFVIRAAVPLLRRSDAAHIVNVSSESSHEPFPHLLVYAATKAALEVLSAGLVLELREDRIRVTVLKLGRTLEGEFRSDWDDADRAQAEAMWDTMGYRSRVSGVSPQSADRVVEAILFVTEQPPDSMVDVMHMRGRP
jgi:NADP-dependent 3-hydroxy acid dehydrogenase YdfG